MRLIFPLVSMVLVTLACRAGSGNSDADALAVKQYQKNGQVIIEAQEPGDMKVVNPNPLNPGYRMVATVDGKEKRLGDLGQGMGAYFISVKEQLGKKVLFWNSGPTVRNVFALPSNDPEGKTAMRAANEGWEVLKIISNAESYFVHDKAKIYCPSHIEYKDQNGKIVISKSDGRACEAYKVAQGL